MARMWKKGNFSLCTAGGKADDAATKENTIEGPQKNLKIKLSGYISKESQNTNLKNMCNPIFTAALFTNSLDMKAI